MVAVSVQLLAAGHPGDGIVTDFTGLCDGSRCVVGLCKILSSCRKLG